MTLTYPASSASRLPWRAALLAAAALSGLAAAGWAARRGGRGVIPRAGGFDSTAALLREGYLFIGRRCRRLGSDVFRTRLMLRPAICVQGEAAARMFYAPGRFTRKGALPPTALLSLQDLGSVQTLDGAAHRHRKAMFLALASPLQAARLGDAFEAEWRRRSADWADREIVFLHEARLALTRAVCAWAGIPLSEPQAHARAREFGAMIDGAGAAGPRNWRGLALRRRTERWARGLIRAVRAGRLAPPDDTALAAIAWHRDPAGRFLRTPVAAVELLNVLRPTVAVDRYLTFAAMALHSHPEWRARLAHSESDRRAFAEEVRRVYPFFPAVGGRALKPFTWRGVRFRRGTWVVLDVFGTNRDPRAWDDPAAFSPERHLQGETSPYNLIPQGGGDPASGHRCPGEPITLELMSRTLRLLAETPFEVPPQNLSIRLSRLPAVPESRLRLRLEPQPG